jgi:hypothetical protein
MKHVNKRTQEHGPLKIFAIFNEVNINALSFTQDKATGTRSYHITYFMWSLAS